MVDKVVVNYHDSLLRSSDVSLLEPSKWINDNIIGFAFEYYEREEFKELSGSIAFISPQVTQCVKLMQVGEAQILLEPLGIQEKDLVFFAVNDNRSLDAAGGSHWSLLKLSKPDQTCFHYDSSRPANIEASRDLFNILNPMFDGKLKLVEAETPQQVNSCDCGLYVILIAEHLCQQLTRHSSTASVSIGQAINPMRIKKKRNDLKDLISHVANNGKCRTTAV